MSSQTQQAGQIFAKIQEDAEDCYSVILLYSTFSSICHFMFGYILMYLIFNLSGPSLISALLKGKIRYKYR